MTTNTPPADRLHSDYQDFISPESNETIRRYESLFQSYSDIKSFVDLVEGRVYDPSEFLQAEDTLEEDDITDQCVEEGVPDILRTGYYWLLTSMPFIEVILEHAVSRWCCIEFKVAPIRLNLICREERHTTPRSLLYSIAAISLISLPQFIRGPSRHHNKESAMILYQEAKRYNAEETLDDGSNVNNILSYFCLSYISGLLSLNDDQRTWSVMASIAIQQNHAKDAIWQLCWYRWYYIDAWMSLTCRKRESVLPNTLDLQIIQDTTAATGNHAPIQQFAILAFFIRQYIKAIKSHQLTSITGSVYGDITSRLEAWYYQSPNRFDVHFYLCYKAVRLLIYSHLLQSEQHPMALIIVIYNALQTNLFLLNAFHWLRIRNCDSSTYHYVYFAIHTTAYTVYDKLSDMSGNDVTFRLQKIALEQMEVNLALLRRTLEFCNGTFRMQECAERCLNDIQTLDDSGQQDVMFGMKSQMFVFHAQDKGGHTRRLSDTLIGNYEKQTKSRRWSK